MRIVIMADGKGTRWNHHMKTTKHLVRVNGEPLIQRTVRIVREIAKGSEIIVTSHDPRYEFYGSMRYEPKNNELEIDRFTDELIKDNMCFLYGDTYYTENAIKAILKEDIHETCFFGNNDAIVAIRICNATEFRKHKKLVRDSFLNGMCSICKGWQVYQSYTSQNLKDKPIIKEKFTYINDETSDINTAEDYKKII